MITSIIFSKDRPLQLDLCLKSIKSNFLDTDQIIVIEKYTDKFRDSLDILKSEHNDVMFFKQTDSIYLNLLDIAKLAKNNYICFFTDDNIFYVKFKLDGYDLVFDPSQEICCISLRLGLNINKRSHLGKMSDDIGNCIYSVNNTNLFIVSKTDNKYGSYWSYSHSVDGHIFRKSHIVYMIQELSHLEKIKHINQTPNELESQMQKYWAISENWILFPEHSCVVNSPNNRVSNTHNENISGEYHNLDIDILNRYYISGKRIKFENILFPQIECPHQEIDILSGLS